jgi:DMSO/TMAO reductase YedYZ molybdopterin-dependent catalytic subunit
VSLARSSAQFAAYARLMPRMWLQAATGVAAIGAGLAAQLLMHWGSSDIAIAPVVLAQAVIAVIPPAITNVLIPLLEHWAMRLLVAGCVAAYLACGALAGWRQWGVFVTVPWIIGPVGALLIPAAAAQPALSAVAAVVAAAVSWGVFGLGTPSAHDVSRRRVIAAAGALVAVIATAGLRMLAATESGIAGTPLNLRRPPRPASPADPAHDPPALVSANVQPDVTPNPSFYVVDEALIDPRVNLETWRLVVDGRVASAFELSYDDLLELPSVEQYQTLECISNVVGGTLISNAVWVGVPVHALLDRATLQSDARKVIFHSVEGYSSAIPVEVARDPQTLVAYGMNGDALPREHGFPARLLIPGRYGMKNVKWLGRIEATPEDYLGFWERRGWSDSAIVQTMSRIDWPSAHGDVRAGQAVTIAGIAYAGARGVARVEVSFDGGKAWREAELGKRYSRATWRRWAVEWTPERGAHELRVRAYDDEGAVQIEKYREPLPDGATGFHAIPVQGRG